MSLSEKQKRLSLFSIFLTYFLDNFGLAIIYPIFTPFFLDPEYTLIAANTTHFIRTLLLGLLIGAFPFAQFFGAPIIGQCSDRIGRKRVFFFTIFGVACGYALTAVSIWYYSLFFLFASRLLTGLFAGNLTLCLAAVADMSHDEQARAKNFGLLSAIGGISFVIAIGFGGLLSSSSLSEHFTPSTPFWIISTLSFLNLLCVYCFFSETHQPKEKNALHPFKGFAHLIEAIRSPEVRALYCVNFLFMLTWVGFMQFLPAALITHFQFGTLPISLCLMGVGFFWILSNFFANRSLSKHFYPGRTLLVSLSLLSALFFSLALFHSHSSFFAFLFLASSCAALVWTNGLATVSLKAPLSMQGSILGINQSVTSLAAMISPPIGGLIFGVAPYSISLLGALACLAAFCVLYKSKQYRH